MSWMIAELARRHYFSGRKYEMINEPKNALPGTRYEE
jgi:hypothetical protein